jgi:hypothetical protein
LTVVASSAVVALYVIGWFDSGLLDWLNRKQLFEAVVIVVLLELLIRVSRPPDQSGPVVYTDEIDAQAKIFEVTGSRRIESATILSAGLSSRRALVTRLVQAGVTVKVLAQDPKTSVDRSDARRTLDTIELIKMDCASLQGHLELYFHEDLASLRAVVLRERSNGVKHAFVGWYTYRESNSQVIGSSHPTLYFDTRQDGGRSVIDWIEAELERHLMAAYLVPVVK